MSDAPDSEPESSSCFGARAEEAALHALAAVAHWPAASSLAALRTIKNYLIGSAHSKSRLVAHGLVPLLKQSLSDAMQQAAPTAIALLADCLGSLALPVAGKPAPRPGSFFEAPVARFHVEPTLLVMSDSMDVDGAQPVPEEERVALAVVQAGVPAMLVAAVQGGHSVVVVAAVRALKTIAAASCAARCLETEEVAVVAQCLLSKNPRVAENTAHFLACMCATWQLPISCILTMAPEKVDLSSPTASRLPQEILRLRPGLRYLTTVQQHLHQRGTTAALVDMVLASQPSRAAALRALSELSFENEVVGRYLLLERGLLPPLVQLVQAATDGALLAPVYAAKCLVNILRACGDLLQHTEPAARLLLIPVLLRLFRCAQQSGQTPLVARSALLVQEEALLTLARLVESDKNLQCAAIEAGAVDLVAAFLKEHPVKGVAGRPRPGALRRERVWVGAFLLLASVSCLNPEGRAVVAKHLPEVVSALAHPNCALRSASCRVIQSLSRSLKQLRTSLLDEHVAAPLIKLLSDVSTEVQINASAAVCNLVLAFSACRSESLSNGGIGKLAQLTRAEQAELRCNGIWSLRNLVYSASEDTKREILREIGKATWEALLADIHQDIQVQAIILLRNIVSANYALLLDERLFDCKQLLLQKLDTDNSEMRRQCLFVICNICAEAAHRSFGMDPAILAHVRQGLTHTDENIRLVAVLCLINLTSRDKDGSEGQRKVTLQEFGFQDYLKLMASKEAGRLADHINTCLRQFAESALLPDLDQVMTDRPVAIGSDLPTAP